jgi:PAS domain S-box-containing protein
MAHDERTGRTGGGGASAGSTLTPERPLLGQRFSLVVLDFDPAFILISGASVTREGAAGPLGCDPGASLLKLFSPADARKVRPLAKAALAGQPDMLTLTAPLDGGERLVRVSVLPRMVDGRPCGIVVTLQDVTARRDGIARLQALEDRLQAILTHAADSIVVIDVQGRIEGANVAAEQLTGWTEAELIGRPIHMLMAEPDRSGHAAHIARYLATGVSGILNVGPRLLTLLRKDGVAAPIELSVGEAIIAGQRKFIGVCRDATVRLQRDADLRSKIDELEILSAGLETQKQALQDLAQETQLARDAAERANLAKSRFVATMSHELRTPLNGILAVADALSRRDLAKPDLDLVSIIQSSGQGLLSILNEVLDLARVEAGALLLDPRPFSPAETLAAVADVWRFAAEGKGLDLRVAATRLPRTVVGDGGRLRQVLSNLLNNAIKFTDRGVVTLVARPVGRGGRRLRFEVVDSGPGIQDSQRERLFEPFVQADASTTRRHGGTGLGLAICRELVTLMGGRIWAEGARTGGARIVFELEFEPGPALQPASEALDEAASLGGDPLILVAEDHPLNRMVASIVLGEAGLRHEFVEDGEAAVAAVASGRFDIVLMDVHMPKMDGLAAARSIRRLSGPAARIPIIAVTANASPPEVAECLQAGMDDFVSKPISAGALLQSIARRLDPRARAPEAAADGILAPP